MVLRRLGLDIRGRKYDTMILHYLLDPESRHNMNALSEKIPQLQAHRDRNADRQGFQAADDGSGERRARQGVRRRRCRRHPATQTRALPSGREDRAATPLFRGRGAHDRRAGRHRDGGRADRLRGAGRILRRTEPQAGRTGSRDPCRSRRIDAQHQLGTPAGRGAFRQDAHRRKAQDDQDQAVLHRRGLFADVRPQTPHRRPDPRIPGCQKKLLSTYVEALPQLVNRTTGVSIPPFNQAVTATGRLSSTNPNLQNIPVREDMGAASAGRSFPPTIPTTCCSRPITARSSCA